MDNFNLLLDLIDHPESFSEADVEALLRDPETRKLYDTMVEARATFAHHDARPDVNDAWERFSKTHDDARLSRRWRKAVAAVAALLIISGIALAAIFWPSRQVSPFVPRNTYHTGRQPIGKVARRDTATAPAPKPAVVRTFENIQLEQMLAEMAVSYGVQVKFRSNAARSLRIYYTWSSTMPLQKVLDELNRFKQFRVTLDGDTLIVE